MVVAEIDVEAGDVFFEAHGDVVRRLGLPEIKMTEVLQAFEVLDSFIGDPCSVDVQILQVGDRCEVRETSVGDGRALQVERCEILESGHRCEAGIGGFGVGQIQSVNLLGNAREKRDLGITGWRAAMGERNLQQVAVGEKRNNLSARGGELVDRFLRCGGNLRRRNFSRLLGFILFRSGSGFGWFGRSSGRCNYGRDDRAARRLP